MAEQTTPKKQAPTTRQTATPKLPRALQRQVDVMRAAGIPERRIQQYMSVNFSAGPMAQRRAERREKFLRREAAKKFGTPP